MKSWQSIALAHSDIIAAIRAYISRNDDEIAYLEGQQRQNRPKSPRYLLLKSLKEKDKAEFRNGMTVPDITDEKNRDFLLNWYLHVTDIRNGDYNSINLIKTVRVVDPGHNEGAIV